jgi:hypothetical protein
MDCKASQRWALRVFDILVDEYGWCRGPDGGCELRAIVPTAPGGADANGLHRLWVQEIDGIEPSVSLRLDGELDAWVLDGGQDAAEVAGAISLRVWRYADDHGWCLVLRSGRFVIQAFGEGSAGTSYRIVRTRFERSADLGKAIEVVDDAYDFAGAPQQFVDRTKAADAKAGLDAVDVCKVRTVYGGYVHVLAYELDRGGRHGSSLLRLYSKHGLPLEAEHVHIHYDNIDPSGRKSAANNRGMSILGRKWQGYEEPAGVRREIRRLHLDPADYDIVAVGSRWIGKPKGAPGAGPSVTGRA